METPETSPAERRDPRNAIAAGICLAVWSAVGWWSTAGNPALWSDEYGTDPGPGLLPKLVLTILSIGALTLILSGMRRTLAAHAPPGYWRGLLRHTLAPALLVGSLLIYFPAIKIIGFIPASGIFAFGWIVALGFNNCEGGTRVLLMQAAAGTLIGVGLIQLVFVYLIGVPLR